MSSEKKKDPDGHDSSNDLEREIRKGRRFGMAEAIGRAGGGTLKGASPIPRSHQALLEMGNLLETRLPDPEGSLRAVIKRELGQSASLPAADPEQAAAGLAAWVRGILETPARLQELVRQADVRWGRDYGEKPRFNRPGSEPEPDDPYTPASVREALQELLRQLD